MATLEQVIDQMTGSGLPSLPSGHPLLDGKIHRFGRAKKAWYVLRELTLTSGRRVVTGAYGIWQGQEQNAVPVTIDWEGVTPAERAEAERKQAEQQQLSDQRKQRAAELAANRAAADWGSAAEKPHAYLERKRVGTEGTRVMASGQLLVPARKYSAAGVALSALQRIEADGSKRFSTGGDMIGACCLLGTVNADTPLIEVGEGYATVETVRMATCFDTPAMVAFNAGNLLPVAKQLRRDFPNAHLLFLADDDMRLIARLADALLKDFDAEWLPVIDGADHEIQSKGGDIVRVRATWRNDAADTPYIEADIRAGRQVALCKFENAGISRARAAARAVGNASVVWPQFADRVDDKWSDFNDLYLAESLEVVRDQVLTARSRALIGEPAGAVAGDDVPAHFDDVPLDDARDAFPASLPEQGAQGTPPAPSAAEAPVMTGIFTLQWALSHCALVQGSTDVWDSLNKLRMKRAAFVDMVGKEGAAAWSTHTERRSINPRNLPKTIRGVAVDEGGAGADNHIVMMLDRYTLLYGTKTVWDAEKRTVIAYDAMALARSSDLASRWISHPMHREVDLDKLVFDPTQRVDLDTHINMFEGFPLKPKKDQAKAQLALGLLHSLCSSEANCDEIFHWILCWLAYPLQNPGAKMQTAILMFGEKQGTGKSLFFEGIVKPIYGAHGATGGQHQLEAQYTHWRSQKLFVLFEEILSRQDKYSHFGLIKHMITGRDMPISQKFKDDRTEANHMNVVMLSNEFQAVPIEPEDRRFQVAEARNPLDPSLLAQIQAALTDGLSEAFYAFLLEYPLDGFTPHTKPIMTASKERMINFGRPDWEAFYLAWQAGDLSVPYCSCLSEHLYVMYGRYCSRFGFKALSLTKFSELIAQRVKKDRQWVTIGGAAKKLLTVLHVPQPEEEAPESLSQQCERFYKLADIKGTA
jgi:putative DNA primase/helicase